MSRVHLLDYVAGNVRSLVNAIEKLGYRVEWIKSPEEVAQAENLILPGVGHFGHCLSQLRAAGFLPAIQSHIDAGKPFLGICVGLQALFEGSSESLACAGLGLVPGRLERFDGTDKAVPHIGWNDARSGIEGGGLYGLCPTSKYYYVHSYRHAYTPGRLEAFGWHVAAASYGADIFVGALARGAVVATQFHPEKSGVAGLRFLRAFLDGSGARALASLSRPPDSSSSSSSYTPALVPTSGAWGGLTRRIIACLDVRANDQGDLVVTKGDQYDVRERSEARGVRNLGKPVDLARRYYEQGADEITFLNITSFRDLPVADLPMLEVLRRASETVFVPLTVGGGIRDAVAADGSVVTALDVATLYFKSGADKVSIGSDAVAAAEEYYARGAALTGRTAVEQISRAYGSQAVVVSIDPRRVYVAEAGDTRHATLRTARPGPAGEEYCWYACTVRGGRETRDVDVVELVRAVEAMGCGELLLNCIDRDGTSDGFDLELVAHVKAAAAIPVIASSGAGTPDHFLEVFGETATDAALAAGMFHRGEYTVQQVKDFLGEKGMVVRPFEGGL